MTRVPSTDVLRLQVADDPDGLQNLVANPNGELGGWGWVTPTLGTAMSGDPDGGGLTYSSTAVGVQSFQTEDMAIPAGYYVAGSARLISSVPPPATGLWLSARFTWVDALGAVISSTTPSPWSDAATPGVRLYGPNLAPVGAVKVRLVVSVARNSAGDGVNSQPFSLTFDQATVAAAATAAELGSMRANLVPDPSFEATPITANWQPSGAGVSITRDTAEHEDGAASCRLNSTVTSTRTNRMRNPSFITDLVGWMTSADTHTTFARNTDATSLDGHSVLLHGDGTQNWVHVRGETSNVIPVHPGDRLAGSASFRFGAAGGNWTGTTFVQLVYLWCDLAGNLVSGTSMQQLARATKGESDQGVWFSNATLWGQVTVPATVSVSGGGTVVPEAVRVGIRFNAGRNISAGMTCQADRFLVEVNPAGGSVGPYFDGSTADTSTVTYDWVTASGSSDSLRTSTEVTKLGTSATPGVRTLAQFAVRGGRDYTISAATMLLPPPVGDPRLLHAEVRWYDSSHNALTPASTVAQFNQPVDGVWVRQPVTVTSPAAAAFATVAIYPDSIGAVEAVYVDSVMVEAGTTMGSFIVGQITTSGLPYLPPVSWLDIIGATHDITVTRESLNVGTMTATVLDANLDPSNSDLIRPGRDCRLMAWPDGGPDWSPIFTGSISQAEVTYDPEIPAPKRAKVTLSAVDALATLANIARGEGVGTIHDLPYVLEGCGVPWDVNGSGNQVPSAIVVARNDSSSALDQVAITRDSALGVAWLDRFGVLHAWDTPPSGTPPVLDEDRYSNVDISFNTAAVINEVNLAFQRYNPSTGDTEEVPYGPYIDTDSVAEWGAFSADFRVQGITETTAALAAYANAILTANATPVRRINSVVVPIKRPEDITPDLALLDLETLTDVSNVAADLADALRITSVQHRITTTTWVVTFGFSVDGQVAAPTFTPAPGNTGGLTLNQLLRPVGEVTMFYGAKVDIPDGWLPLDGTTFSSTTYPDLAALLGGTTLPNMTDRFPIGAGTKALGTTGGNPTKTIAAANLPPHTHTTPAHNHPYDVGGATPGSANGIIQRGSGSATATITGGYNPSTSGAGATTDGGFANTALDVMNPWRSLWFIIRAT